VEVLNLLDGKLDFLQLQNATGFPSHCCSLKHASATLDSFLCRKFVLSGNETSNEALNLSDRRENVLFEIALLGILHMDIGIFERED